MTSLLERLLAWLQGPKEKKENVNVLTQDGAAPFEAPEEPEKEEEPLEDVTFAEAAGLLTRSEVEA